LGGRAGGVLLEGFGWLLEVWGGIFELLGTLLERFIFGEFFALAYGFIRRVRAVIRTSGLDIRTFGDFIRTIYFWRIFCTGSPILLEELRRLLELPGWILELLGTLLEQFIFGKFFALAHRFY